MSKVKVPKFLLEIFSIIFAVLLALALDGWKENVKQQKRIDSAMEDIALEIESFTGLNTALEYNQKVLNALDSTIERYQKHPDTVFPFGLGRPEIRSLAWETSKENGITAGFDRQIFLEMAEVYVEFDRLTNILDYHSQFNLESDPDMSAYTKARHIRRQLSQTIFRIGELEKKAGRFLEKHADASFTQALRSR